MVVIGGHLDSWDLGTGAIDDGAGVAITMAAGHLIGELPKAQRPARTIRVIAFANEEQGLYGGTAYAADSTRRTCRKHQLGAESDFGAGRIYALRGETPRLREDCRRADRARRWRRSASNTVTDGDGAGPDCRRSTPIGTAWAGLAQDGTDYFDLHHTPDDTLDKIDPKALAQNVAAYAVFAYLAARADGDFGSAPKPAAP